MPVSPISRECSTLALCHWLLDTQWTRWPPLAHQSVERVKRSWTQPPRRLIPSTTLSVVTFSSAKLVPSLARWSLAAFPTQAIILFYNVTCGTTMKKKLWGRLAVLVGCTVPKTAETKKPVKRCWEKGWVSWRWAFGKIWKDIAWIGRRRSQPEVAGGGSRGIGLWLKATFFYPRIALRRHTLALAFEPPCLLTIILCVCVHGVYIRNNAATTTLLTKISLLLYMSSSS